MSVATRPAVPISAPPAAIAAGSVVAALITGLATAVAVSKGVVALLGVLYLPIALINLPLAIVLWVPLVHLTRLDVVGLAPTAAALLIGFAWLGTLRRHGWGALELLRAHARLIALVGVFLVWITTSMLWATDAKLAAQDYWQWLLVTAAFAVVVTTVSTGRQVRLFAIAFVVGALLSVLVALLGNQVTGSDTAIEAAADEQRRLGGRSGDPNFLAAGIVPAIVLVTGLFRRGRVLTNLALGVAAIALTVGFVATESRGGLVAAAVAIVAALVFYRRRRAYVVAFVAVLVGVAAAWFSINPHAWERISDFDTAGNGRSELWEVAWHMTGDHPVAGVGLNNFTVESARYVDRPGNLEFVSLIVERPHVAHNAYLQLLAETGIVGLALFLGVLLGCLRASWRAAGRFRLLRDDDGEAMARAILVAGIAAAASSFFLSNAQDLRLWLLLALGPAALSSASRRPYDLGDRSKQ